MSGMLTDLEAPQSPGGKIGIIEPIIEHGRAKKHAVDTVARPVAIGVLARNKPFNTALRYLGWGGFDVEQRQERPGRGDHQADGVVDIAAGQTAREILAPATI